MLRNCTKIRYSGITVRSLVSLKTAASRSRVLTEAPRSIRYNSTQAATDASTETTTTAPGELPSEKIVKIVDSISKLTLLETSELIKHLQKTLNLPDTPMMTMGQPMQGGVVAGGVGGAAKQDGAAGSEESAAPAAEEEEQTTFSVKMTAFDTKSKAKIIKEIKSLLGLSLVDAKKFVESSPRMVKEHLSKEESDALKKKLESLGAKIELE